MLAAIFEFRTRVCELYQKLQRIIDPIFKFLLSFLVIRTINTVIGYDARLSRTIVTIGLSVVCAFVPSSILALVCLLLTVAHVFSVNMILAIFVGLILLVLYCFFVRFAPKYGYVIVAMPVLFLFRVPYLFPLLLGMIGAPVAALPLACGIFFYYMISVIQNAVALQIKIEGFDTENIMLLVNNVVDNLMNNTEMFLTIILYCLVLVLVYVVRRMSFDYSFECAILIGLATSIFGHVYLNTQKELALGLGLTILYHLISGLLAFLIYFFIRVLDYTAVEHVQFEDDEYFYYVRAVPKIKVGLPQLNVRRVTDQSYFASSLENDEEFFQPDEMERKLMEKRSREAKERSDKKKQQRIDMLKGLFSFGLKEEKEENLGENARKTESKLSIDDITSDLSDQNADFMTENASEEALTEHGSLNHNPYPEHIDFTVSLDEDREDFLKEDDGNLEEHYEEKIYAKRSDPSDSKETDDLVFEPIDISEFMEENTRE